MFDALLQKIMDEVTVVKDAPFVFCIAVFLAGIIIFMALEWFHREKVETQEKRISLLTELEKGSEGPVGQGKDRAKQPAPSDSKGSIPEKQIVTTSPPTMRAGLYVGEVRFDFTGLEKDRHSELTMRVFNGTGSVVEFSSLQGKVKFSDAGNTDPDRMGTLPTPTLRSDTARTIATFQEWFLILTQRAPAIEADKLLAMLAADIPIHFDLRELTIEVVGQHDRNKVERLPIWGGVTYSRGSGFLRKIYGEANIRL